MRKLKEIECQNGRGPDMGTTQKNAEVNQRFGKKGWPPIPPNAGPKEAAYGGLSPELQCSTAAGPNTGSADSGLRPHRSGIGQIGEVPRAGLYMAPAPSPAARGRVRIRRDQVGGMDSQVRFAGGGEVQGDRRPSRAGVSVRPPAPGPMAVRVPCFPSVIPWAGVRPRPQTCGPNRPQLCIAVQPAKRRTLGSTFLPSINYPNPPRTTGVKTNQVPGLHTHTLFLISEGLVPD
jgi:hypothetical protein